MGGRRRRPDIWIPQLRFVHLLNNFHVATMTIRGILQVRIAIVKAFLADFWPKIWLGHVTCEWGVVDDPILEFLDPDLPIYYITFMGLRWPLRVVYRWASSLLRPFWREIFQVPSKIGEKLAFWGKMGSECKLFSGPPKGISLRETTSFDIWIVKIGAGVLTVGAGKNQKN